jgi:CheY-like chemotaxis protein
MDKATIERIFDPFFTTKPVGQGTGLGLSTVHGIMQSHDGAVTVYSEPGKGSTFRLYFPAVGEAAMEVRSPRRELPQANGERVLYVDDERALVQLVTRILGRLGYVVAGYTDPAQALLAFKASPNDYDAVVTDLSMPVLSGFDLSRAILETRPEIPIVMISGYVRPEDQQTALQIGIRELILKPNTIDELGRALDEVLRGKGGPVSGRQKR